MNDTEKLLVIGALAGVIWIAFARQGSESPSSITVSGNASTNVPWFLNYNTTPPIVTPLSETMPSFASGIQNDTNNDNCPGCSMFGVTYGSQY